MYELLDAVESNEQLFLIRIAQNRMTVDNRRILDAIRKKRCIGRVEITGLYPKMYTQLSD